MARIWPFCQAVAKAVINHASLSGPDCQQLDCFGYDRPFDSIGLPRPDTCIQGSYEQAHCRQRAQRRCQRRPAVLRTSCGRSSRPTWTRASTAASSPVSRRSPMATCTSVTPSRSASTSAWLRNSGASATCVSTIPTRPRKTRSTSTPSRAMSSGWASTGPATCATPPTTSTSCTTGRSS